ncbi:MAG: efflux RND transporter periplasmic adaptor subunit [Syntrophobacteraceae bacterium]|jgi:RND family efflux transporter MFP subunit
MKKPLLLTLFLIVIIGSFTGGAWYNRSGSGGSHNSQNQRRILHYVDPMNPAHTSDKPGVAPCGMPLEPVYADEASTAGGPQNSPHLLSSGAVHITPQKQQLIGVQVDTVQRVSETHVIRALGRIVPDENRVYRMLAGSDGWIFDVHESTTGSLVQKDQLMATFYSSDFLSKQQEYLGILRSRNPAQQPGAQQSAMQQPAAQQPAARQPTAEQPGVKPRREYVRGSQYRGPQQAEIMEREAERHAAMQRAADQRAALQRGAESHGAEQPKVELPKAEHPKHEQPGLERLKAEQTSAPAYYDYRQESARVALLGMGVGETQLDEIERTRRNATYIEIQSPATGLVLSRNVSPRQRVDRGAELFRIADLSRVWVVADIFSSEAQYIHPGNVAKVSLPGQGRSYDATVSEVPAQFDPATRTLKVRLDAVNPEDVLRPEMFVDVDFVITLQPALTVPSDALLDSGLKKTVFVDRGNGFFEPRTVKTGWRFDGRVEILEGLTAGERIVTSGNFLIDSESRMKLAAAGLYGASEKDPVCGMEVYTGKAKPAGLTSDFEGKTYYFCSAGCKAEFDKNHSGHQAAVLSEAGQNGASGAEKADAPSTVAKDPVCGMAVQQKEAEAADLVSDYGGAKYYFCCKHCKELFDKAPQSYLDKADAAQQPHVHEGHEHD